ncbi:MAG: DUF4349 domain-containing protein [Lachnospiraceae bacterium]|nr:DUF4349 domain-containing protein [Lachnospiraceae bacterium]
MKRKAFTPVTALVLMSLILSACGSSKSSVPLVKESSGSGYYDDEIAASYGAPEEARAYSEDSYEEYDSDDVSAEISTAGNTLLTDDPGASSEISAQEETTDTSRKLIKTVNLSVETEQFDELLTNVNKKIERLGGYVESSYVGGRSYGSTANRTASITARIPAAKLDEFTDSVTEESNVLSQNDSTEDVTLNYVDMKAKVESLKTERDRLNDLLAQADSLEVILALEERLAEVRYEIESYESRLRVMDNQVTYSTVYLDIEEVGRYTPTPTNEQTLGQRMGEAFVSSFETMGKFLQDLAVAVVTVLPFLLLIAVFAGGILLIIYAVNRSRKNKHSGSAKKGSKNAGENGRPNGKNFDPMTGKPVKDESGKTADKTSSEKTDDTAK